VKTVKKRRREPSRSGRGDQGAGFEETAAPRFIHGELNPAATQARHLRSIAYSVFRAVTSAWTFDSRS
jgi:hypothetical protein